MLCVYLSGPLSTHRAVVIDEPGSSFDIPSGISSVEPVNSISMQQMCRHTPSIFSFFFNFLFTRLLSAVVGCRHEPPPHDLHGVRSTSSRMHQRSTVEKMIWRRHERSRAKDPQSVHRINTPDADGLLLKTIWLEVGRRAFCQLLRASLSNPEMKRFGQMEMIAVGI